MTMRSRMTNLVALLLALYCLVPDWLWPHSLIRQVSIRLFTYAPPLLARVATMAWLSSIVLACIWSAPRKADGFSLVRPPQALSLTKLNLLLPIVPQPWKMDTHKSTVAFHGK